MIQYICIFDADHDPVNAAANFLKALQLTKQVGDARVQIRIHNNLGQLFRRTGQFAKAIDQYEKALSLARISRDASAGSIRNNLAWVRCFKWKS